MLLTKSVKVKMNSKHITKYRNKGYVCKINETIVVDVSDLLEQSTVLVKVECDVCHTNKVLTYRNYLININNGGYYSCSNKCSKNKYKNTMLEKYGVENSFQAECVKDKIKETNLEKYGVEHNSYNPETLEKRKQSNLEKYGKEWYISTEEFKIKSKETCLEKYGVDNVSKSKEMKEKLSKILSSNEVREKVKKTNLERYGYEYAIQNPNIFKKRLQSSFKIRDFINTNLYYQGTYELDFLKKYYDKILIENGVSINYIFEKKNKMYHSDFYLPDYNLIIEVKSEYTLNLHLKKNLRKHRYSKLNGYNHIFIIDKNYSELEEILKLF